MASHHILQTIFDVGSTLALLSSLVVIAVLVVGLIEARRNTGMLRQLEGTAKPARSKLAPRISTVSREASQPSTRVA